MIGRAQSKTGTMPLTLISSTGALEFRPTRLLSFPVLVDADYDAASSEPDEVIAPPPRPATSPDRIWAGLLAAFLFCLLQAAVLGPPLLVAHVILS